MKNVNRCFIMNHPNGARYVCRSKNKRISLINLKEDDSLIINIKRLKKDFDGDGKFASFTSERGLLIGEMRLTNESAKELMGMLYSYFLNKK